MNIIRITRKKNVRILNTHNDYLFPTQDILEIEFENKQTRIIDLFCGKDITEIDYFKVEESKKTKSVNLFLDSDLEVNL